MYSTIEEILSKSEKCNCGSAMKCEETFKRELTDSEHSTKIQLFKILTCFTCNSITILRYTMTCNVLDNAELMSGEPPAFKYNRTILYSPPEQLHHAINKNISELLNQAIAIVALSPRASFILCREMLEKICFDNDIEGENLFVKLSKLIENKVQLKDLNEIIHSIKLHDNLTIDNEVKIEDAEKLIVLVKYVIERLSVDEYRHQEAVEALNCLKSKISMST